MDLAQMETKFRERTSGLAADLPVVDIDAYLNRWYQYNIPATVGRDLMEGVWRLECEFLVAEYDYPAYVVAPRSRNCWIRQHKVDFDTDPTLVDLGGTNWVDSETDRTAFVALDEDFPRSPTGSLPTHILFSDRKATISPVPDKGYIIEIPCRMGPPPLETTGIANEAHALAVVTGAATEYLTDKEDHVGSGREASWYDYYIDRMRTFTNAKARHRRPNRSF